VRVFANNILCELLKVKCESTEFDDVSTVTALPSSPTVTRSKLTDSDLLSLSTPELNRRLQSMSSKERKRLKQRRQTLKNRGYARKCRARRISDNCKLLHANQVLVAEVNELKERMLSLSTRHKLITHLNHHQQSMSSDEQICLRQRRQLLKNRGYIQTCRARSINDNHLLQHTNEVLVAEVNETGEREPSVSSHELNDLQSMSSDHHSQLRQQHRTLKNRGIDNHLLQHTNEVVVAEVNETGEREPSLSSHELNDLQSMSSDHHSQLRQQHRTLKNRGIDNHLLQHTNDAVDAEANQNSRVPTVTSSKLSDDALLSLSTCELNHHLRSVSCNERRRLKQRRRTLKNRSYARTCRTRRITELRRANEAHLVEVNELKERLHTLTAERDDFDHTLQHPDEALVAEINELKERVLTLTVERDYYHQQHQQPNEALVAEVNELKIRLHTLTTERDYCDQALRHQNEAVVAQVTELKERVRTLTAERDYYRQHERQPNEALVTELNELKDKVHTLTSERDYYDHKLQQTNEAVVVQMNELKERVRTLTVEREYYREQFDRLLEARLQDFGKGQLT